MSTSRIKTIEHLTKTLGIIFAISLVSLVHKLDSFDLERDIDSLRVLEHVNAPVHLQHVFDYGTVFEKALQWLTNHRKDLGRKNADMLREMQNLLGKAGLRRMAVFDLKSPTIPGTKYSLIRFPNHRLDSIPAIRNRHHDIHQLTVKELLRRFRFFTKPREIIAATELESREIDKIDLSRRSEDFRLRRVFLSDNNMAVAFLGISDRRVPNAAPWDYELIVIKAKVMATDGPSFYTLLNGEKRDVEDLARNESQLTRLAEIYGRLQFSLAKSLASEDFSRAYRSIVIFGLTFSTRRFAFGIILFSLVTLTALAWIVHQSFSAEIPQEQAQIPLHNVYARSLIWIVLPQAAILFALPPFGLSIGENGFLYGGAFATVLMGVIATFRARKLWPREPDSPVTS